MAKQKRHHDSDMRVKRSATGERGDREYSGGKGYINEDKSAPSNCPMQVVMQEYPRTGYLKSDYNDTLYGIDDTIENAVDTARRYVARKKY